MEPKFTPDEVKKLKESRERVSRKPKKVGICDECGGNIVQKVLSLFRGQFSYGSPECTECGSSYPGAENATKVGAAEFTKRMRIPFTV